MADLNHSTLALARGVTDATRAFVMPARETPTPLPSKPPSTPPASRRGLLGGAAVFPAAIAAVTAARGAPGLDPDAELVALAETIMANNAEIMRISYKMDAQGLGWAAERETRERDLQPLVHQSWAMRERLALTTATTPAGFRAKALVLQEYTNCDPGYARPYQDDALAWSLVNDLLGVRSFSAQEDDDTAAEREMRTCAIRLSPPSWPGCAASPRQRPAPAPLIRRRYILTPSCCRYARKSSICAHRAKRSSARR